MKTHKPIVSVMLLTRYKKTNGLYPVKVRISFTHPNGKNERRYYDFGNPSYSLSENDFGLIYGEPMERRFERGQMKPEEFEIKYGKAVLTRDERKTALSDFVDADTEANEIVKSCGLPFSFELYEKKLKEIKGVVAVETLVGYATKHSENLKKKKQFGTANTFDSMVSVVKSVNKPVQLTKVNVAFIESVKEYMKDSEYSTSTISMYLRCIRALLNKAQREKLISSEHYPFTPQSKLIPKAKNTKKSLTMQDISSIMNYQVEPGTKQEYSRDMWLFGYLCNGANMKDIANLRWSNINTKTEAITFLRAKTAGQEVEREISAVLLPEMMAIIEKHGNKRGINNYVFNIFTPEMNEERRHKRIKQEIKNINKYTKRIGEDLELPVKLTTGVCRHSYATISLRAGVSVEFISDSMGHSNIKTTQIYLGSFEADAKKENARKILPNKETA